MKFNKKTKDQGEPPTTSLPDIVFLLLIFFMVTTNFRKDAGLLLDLPTAKKIEKLEAKKNATSIWARGEYEISIDDKLVQVKDIARIMYDKRVENSRLIVSLKFDRVVNMGLVSDIQEKLREADALKVNYCAKYGD
jgi:biopolymer transport protein ExbD